MGILRRLSALMAVMVGIAGGILPLRADQRPFYDRTHESKVLGGPRFYRIFLPRDYDAEKKSYPVVYYFHGHSDRYTLEHYDQGTDTVPRIAAYVAGHELIVVSVDGYVAEDYGGFYGGSPWDIGKGKERYDFGSYFLELVRHIDSTCRTRTDRRHRGTCGLSMGGFMSLYLSARYPDRIGSASAFNPGPEFYIGDIGRRLLWRLRDAAVNHEQSLVRLIHAGGDFISQYHEEMHLNYARNPRVGFEYRRDEYHKHAATSIEETLDFHRKAFAQSALDNTPESWSYVSPFRSFSVWGWDVETEGNPDSSYTCLEGVSQGGLRLLTRRWMPDGPPAATPRTIVLTSAPLYLPGKAYRIWDHLLFSGTTTEREIQADVRGRLQIRVDGAPRQIGIVGPGTSASPPVLLPLSAHDRPLYPPKKEIRLPVRIFNPRGRPMEDVRAELTSDYPTVEILQGSCRLKTIPGGGVADLKDCLRVRFTSGDGPPAPTRLLLRLTYDDWHEITNEIDLLVEPEVLDTPQALEILDGRTMTFSVFRQKGNQGGGSLIERKVTEGKGNGNGVLEPGEQATFWVKILQGLDPFDKNSWHRCRVYNDSPWLEEVELLEEEKQREWTGAQERTSLMRLSTETPRGTAISLLLAHESWSFVYTPDIRFGPEPLYQAIQRHREHLHRYLFRTP